MLTKILAIGHFVENTGTTPLRFLEIFKSGILFWDSTNESASVDANMKRTVFPYVGIWEVEIRVYGLNHFVWRSNVQYML